MGLSLFSSSSSYSTYTPTSAPNLGEPHPWRYTVIRHRYLGRYLVAEIKFPDCQNYEGVKILVYEDATLDDLKKQGIDPHFTQKPCYHSPIARIKPTERGWVMACSFAANLQIADKLAEY